MVNRGTKNSSSSADRVYSKETFVEMFASVPGKEVKLSDMDIDVLLKYLSRDQSAITMEGDVSCRLDDSSASVNNANGFTTANNRRSSSKRLRTPARLLRKTILSPR